MLVALSIRDIVLIDRLDLGFASGLSVLTGETGAGKSIVLDSLSLALGARGDGRLVREGASQGQVTAMFELPSGHAAAALLAEQGLDGDGADLILRRVQLADGRTRAFVNDQPVGVQTLRLLGNLLVEIHGQHDDRALLDPATHRPLLDAFGGHDAALRAVAARHAELDRIETALAETSRLVRSARQEADYLRHAHDELERLAPLCGEETGLADRRGAIMRAEKASEDLREAYDALSGSASPMPNLAALARRLERRGAGAPDLVAPVANALDEALAALEQARTLLERSLRAAAFDPNELESVEERLFALRAAARKYKVPVDDLGALAVKIGADLAAADSGEADLLALERQLADARAGYDAAAAALSQARHAAASRLDGAVQVELPDMKLDSARFMTQVETDPARRSAAGIDRVEFWVRTNPGTRPGPLARTASGGELSRFMLALKVALADRGSAPTLVFDEVDTGVGGAVADAIGKRLARLADRVQVLTVTHAPQVAARAAQHFRIAKEPSTAGDRVATRVQSLLQGERREEIARMLAGAAVTEEARAAAGRLIEGAG